MKMVLWLASLYFIAAYGLSSDDWLNSLIPKPYKRYQAPVNYECCNPDNVTKPVIVASYVTPKFITDISMLNMDFEVDMEILVEWYDNRLLFPSEDILEDSDNTLPADIAEKVWYPSIYLDNCKGNGFLVSTPKTGSSGIMNVGKLWTEVNQQNVIGLRVHYRKHFRFTCNLDLAAYPFDVQQCEIQLTWNYKRSKPVSVKFYTHSHDRPRIARIPVPPGFRMTSSSVEIRDNDTSDVTMVVEHRSLTFTFRRIFGQHVMLIFFPSILIVILSWLSFWLDVDNSASRIALGLTSLLTLATQFGAAQKDLPAIAKIKALDIWMFTCMFMVFMSLIEYGISNYVRSIKPSSSKLVRPVNRCISTKMQSHTNKNVKTARALARWKRGLFVKLQFFLRPRTSTSYVDYISRVIFPTSFLLFNIIFWTYYL